MTKKKSKKQMEEELPRCKECGKIILVCICEKNELKK